MPDRVSCTFSAVSIDLTQVAKSKFPQKTWAHLASMLGLQERAAKYRVSNSRAYTADEIRTLLQSEDGLDFLAAIMADAEPKWWWWAKQVMTVASIKRRRHEDEQEILKLETSAPAETGARRRIKGALDANRNIKAAVDRAETALGVQRPNLDSRDADAAGAGARLSGRSVAPAKRAYAGRGR
ncbi:hypothetical protein RPMA_12305 [Tardiphaga alba]|uniref:Uncharacterized protein n=1 Tax=Tardiphaga alba TaxID=340268 RepID=A0ABX8AA36_9BRAD|nr:hypothetical protein [Tardiphaga alba]QUS39529.1 hypothetical protein RPMA_12305 [Tardiphaga alba]